MRESFTIASSSLKRFRKCSRYQESHRATSAHRLSNNLTGIYEGVRSTSEYTRSKNMHPADSENCNYKPSASTKKQRVRKAKGALAHSGTPLQPSTTNLKRPATRSWMRRQKDLPRDFFLGRQKISQLDKIFV